MKPLLSIVVPTKDRYVYLIPLLKALKKFRSDEFEIIIQDNTIKNEEIIHFIRQINDERIKYFHTAEKQSIIENCDRGILNSNGKYVCMIGDDDGIIPQLIDWVKYLEKNRIDGLLPRKAIYNWPDIEHKYKKLSIKGVVKYNRLNEKLIQIKPFSELKKCIKNGGSSMFKLPRLYHGVVSRAILNEVFMKTKTFFPGPSPDMANAVAISLYMKNYIYIELPLIISGKGYNSNTGQGLRKINRKKIQDVPWLPENTEANWDKKIPKIWTGQTIWGESLLKSLESNMRNDLIKKFNYSALYGNLLARNPSLFKIIIPYLKVTNGFFMGYYFAKIFSKRIINFSKNYLNPFFNNSPFQASDLNSIEECIEYLKVIYNNENKFQ